MSRMGWTGALVLLAGSVLLAQQPPQDDKRLGADLKDVNLHDLTMFVQRVSKRTLLWKEELALRQKRVHFVSDRAVSDDPETLFKVYQSILQVSDLALYPAGEPGQEIYKIENAPNLSKRPTRVRAGTEPLEDSFVTRVFSLQHVKPRDVQAVLIHMASFPQNVVGIDAAGLLVVNDYDYNIKRIEDIIKAVDVKKPDVELKVLPLRNAIAPEIEQMMNGLVQSLIQGTAGAARGLPAGVPGLTGPETVKVVADKRTNAVILLAEPSRLIQLEDIVARLDSETPFETSGIYISHLRHTNALDIARTLNAMYRISVDTTSGAPTAGVGGVRPGQPVGPQPTAGPAGAGFPGVPGVGPTGSEPTIVPDLRSNSIIIVTDRNTYKTLEQIIRRLDQRRPQVLIKATVVEFRANDRFDLGTELTYLQNPENRTVGGGRTNFGGSTLLSDPANNQFNLIPIDTPGISLLLMKDRIGNIPLLIKAFEGKAKVSVHDEPEVATNDNGSAEISFTTRFPVPNTTVTGTGLSQTSFTFEEAKSSLTISPHISEGGYLRLETSVRIEKFTQDRALTNVPPTRQAREIKTKEIVIPNASTMVIGGIVTHDKSEATQGIPVLSQIPLLGAFFRRDTDEYQKATLYIFITPYILYDYSHGDHRELSRERKAEIEALRGDPLRKLNVDAPARKLPDSTFQFQAPRPARKEER